MAHFNALHPQDFVAIMEINIYPGFCKQALQAVDGLPCLCLAVDICFKYFDHCMQICECIKV